LKSTSDGRDVSLTTIRQTLGLSIPAATMQKDSRHNHVLISLQVAETWLELIPYYATRPRRLTCHCAPGASTPMSPFEAARETIPTPWSRRYE
jgi:hypothetical protein